MALWFCPNDACWSEDQRIISLAPHLTELVFTTGAGDSLVGVVAYSDYPEEAKSLPRVGDAFQLDLERITTLQPTVVLAWKSGNPIRSVDKLRSLGHTVEVFETTSFVSIAENLRRIGQLSGTEEAANAQAKKFLSAIIQLRDANKNKPPVRVFYQISTQPIYTINGEHVISEAIEVCGGKNIFSDLETLAPTVDQEAVLRRDPEVIFFGESMRSDAIKQWSSLEQLSATKLQGLYGISADQLSRATTRMLAGTRVVCELIEQTRQKKISLRQDQKP